MTKQTRDKRAIRRCNSKDGQKQWQNRQRTKGQSEAVIQRTDKNNDKTDKGQKGNQKL
jgi:hypothetical protein